MKTYCSNCGFKIEYPAGQNPNFCPKCGNSLNSKNSINANQVQEEEDIELMQMIQAQMGVLEKDFQTEMQRYIPRQEETGGE